MTRQKSTFTRKRMLAVLVIAIIGATLLAQSIVAEEVVLSVTHYDRDGNEVVLSPFAFFAGEQEVSSFKYDMTYTVDADDVTGITVTGTVVVTISTYNEMMQKTVRWGNTLNVDSTQLTGDYTRSFTYSALSIQGGWQEGEAYAVEVVASLTASGTDSAGNPITASWNKKISWGLQYVAGTLSLTGTLT